MSDDSDQQVGDTNSPERDTKLDFQPFDKFAEKASSAAPADASADKNRRMFSDRHEGASHMSLDDRNLMMSSRVDALVSAAHRLGAGSMGSIPAEDEVQNTVKNIKVEEGTSTKHRSSLGPCKVCGDEATGMYFGALVCVPCKTFFLRYAGDNFAFVCKHDKNCEITMTTRTQCKYCRYQKCLIAGMCRRERPAQVQLSEGQQLCVVCQDIANGVHFGAITCEGCKKFFRRGLTEHNTYSCKNEEKCIINPRTRNSCRFCRFKKCIEAGMSREAIQMGRPSKIKHSSSDLDSSGSAAKVQRLNIENISASIARDVVGNMGAPGNGNYGQDNRAGMGHLATDMNNTGMKQFMSPGRMSPPRMQNYSAGAPSDVMHKQMNRGYEPHGQAQMPGMQAQNGAHEPQLPEYPRRDMPAMGYADNRRCTTSPLSDDLSQASPFSEGPSSPPMKQTPRANPIPFNMFPTPSPGSDVRFHGPAGPQKVDPDSVNAAHLIQQIISQNTQEVTSPVLNDNVGVSTAAMPHPKQRLSAIDSVAPAMPIQMACQNIKQEFARAALSMYPPANQVKSPTSCSAPMMSINSPTSDCMPSPDTTSASPLCTTSPAQILPGGVPSPNTLPTPPVPDRTGPVSRQTERPPNPTSTSVLSSLVEFSEHLQTMSQSSGRNRNRSGDEGGNSGQEHLLSDNGDGFQELDFNMCVNYWCRPELPDENLLFSEDHWRIIDRIMPAYNRFVETGSSINRRLRNEVENWNEMNKGQKIPQEWINAKVVPVYTLSSVTFSRDLPDFTKFDISDQCTLVRLGQSQSRILVAATHWYDPDIRDFRDFLSWRKIQPGQEDFFKKQLVEYSSVIHSLELDNIEAGLVNVLVIIAKDYPGLKKPDLIEQCRMKILQTFRAYTTAKYGTPNRRIETLFSHIPELRQLGFMHHRMTLDLQLKAEECIKNTESSTLNK